MKRIYVDTENLLQIYNKTIPKSINELNIALSKAKNLNNDKYNLIGSINNYIKIEESISNWVIKVNNQYHNVNSILVNEANKLPIVNIIEK